MTEIERRLADMFERRGSDIVDDARPPARFLRRSRRRQIGTVTLTAVCLALVIAVPIAGVAIHDAARRPSPRPASSVVLPDAPAGFETGVVPYASIAYPDGWYLLDTSPLVGIGEPATSSPLDGPILQVSNVDPDVAHSPRCMVSDEWPSGDAVMLTIGVAPPGGFSEAEADHTWPVEPSPFPPHTEPYCHEEHEQAVWTGDNGLVYWAHLGWGADASPSDIDAVHRTFASLRVPATGDPWLDRLAAYRAQGSPRAVLGTTVHGDDVLTFVAYLEQDETFWVGVESNGDWTTATAPYSGSSHGPVEAGLSIVGETVSLVDGTIAPEVAHVEVRTGSGDVQPMEILPIPASLGVDDRYVWALLPGQDEDATVVGYDADGKPFGDPVFPTEPSVEIANGDEAGAPWTLEVTHDNTGWGLNMSYGDGSGGGGGEELGDRSFGGMMWSGRSWNIDTGYSALPVDASGVVTDRAERMTYELVDGSTLEARLYDVPDGAFGGGAKAFVLFVPLDVLVNAGDLVLYDADGNEIAREYFDASPVSLFPKVLETASPQALDAMRDLQLAGGVAARYFFDHDGSYEGLDATTASAISADVTYNTSPNALVGEVSLRVGGEKDLVLATRTPSGDVYSACITGGPSGGATEGRNDVSDASDCSNGWLDEP